MFISLEGGEGTGKTTQARTLRQLLEQAGFSVVSVREPGSTALGDYLRQWLKQENRQSAPPTSELFLFAAARSAVVRDVIKPALKGVNTIVIADRYVDSTTAYQGYGQRIPLRDVAMVNRLSSQELLPELTILLDCPLADALTRVDSAQARLPLKLPEERTVTRVDQEGTRRFEEESLDFHERVRSGYLKIAHREPKRVRVVDASASVEDVSKAIWSAVQERLSTLSGGAPSAEVHELPLWSGTGRTDT